MTAAAVRGRVRRERRWRTGLAVAFLAALLAGGAAGRLPPAVPAAYGGLSLVTAVLYARDKGAARAGTRRTRERTLHLAGLLGGWPGGLVAQERSRHKTHKGSFQLIFWLTVALNCVLLAWLLGAPAAVRGAAGAP